jgi:hypothetical protein
MQMQQQVVIHRAPIQEFLKRRLNESVYLEDAFYIYIKVPEDKWQFYEDIVNEDAIIYWYAFTFSGGNTKKLYNIVWGTYDVANNETKLTSGCSYYFDSKAHLAILNKIKSLKKDKGYLYLGGGVRDRIKETLRRQNNISTPIIEKNRNDISSEAKTLSDILPVKLIYDILENIVKFVETSVIATERIPQRCFIEDDCNTMSKIEANEACQIYYQGDPCFIKKATNTKSCKNEKTALNYKYKRSTEMNKKAMQEIQSKLEELEAYGIDTEHILKYIPASEIAKIKNIGEFAESLINDEDIL